MSDVPSNSMIEALLTIPIRGRGICGKGEACGVCAGCEARARKMLATIAVRSQRRRKQSVEPGSEAWSRARNKLLRMLCALDLIPEGQVSTKDREVIEDWVKYCEGMHALGTKGVAKK